MFKKIFTAVLAAVMLTLSAPQYCTAENKTETLALPIVMYHHMSPKSRLWGKYVLSVEQFENDLTWLRDNGYTAITTDELRAWCRGEAEMPEKPVMITFDDGYESTYVYAKPLLEQYGMPSVVSIIGSVARQYSDTPDHMLDYSHMSWEAAADTDAGGLMEVQCHTWNMHKLEARRGCGPTSGESDEHYYNALSEDLNKFCREYEQHIGHPCSVLALPFGMYTDRTLDYAGRLGFRAVLTCTEKVNLLTGDESELMELCRYNRPSGISSEAFFAKWEK